MSALEQTPLKKLLSNQNCHEEDNAATQNNSKCVGMREGRYIKRCPRLGCNDMKMYPLVNKGYKRDMRSDGQTAGLPLREAMSDFDH